MPDGSDTNPDLQIYFSLGILALIALISLFNVIGFLSFKLMVEKSDLLVKYPLLFKVYKYYNRLSITFVIFECVLGFFCLVVIIAIIFLRLGVIVF